MITLYQTRLHRLVLFFSDHHLKQVNNYPMKKDVLQLMGKVLDRQKSTFRPPATEASGYGSGVDTGKFFQNAYKHV